MAMGQLEKRRRTDPASFVLNRNRHTLAFLRMKDHITGLRRNLVMSPDG